MDDPQPPEPWLRGPLPGVDPLLAPALVSFAQVREDLARWTGRLTDEQIWARPGGLAPVGFQLRHIARSVDRLTTYLEGRPLSADQLGELQTEMEPGASRDELLAERGRPRAAADHRHRLGRPSGRAHAAPPGPGDRDGEAGDEGLRCSARQETVSQCAMHPVRTRLPRRTRASSLPRR